MPVPKILVFAGSIRTGSHNARLAALAAKELALADAEVTRISLADYPLPIYDGDPEAESRRAAPRAQSQAAVGGASAACSSRAPNTTPRSRRCMKNAIDWISRVREARRAAACRFQDRAFALGGASTGPLWRHALADRAAPGAGGRLRRAGDPRAGHRSERGYGLRRDGSSHR